MALFRCLHDMQMVPDVWRKRRADRVGNGVITRVLVCAILIRTQYENEDD
jgi:hypothetical protein